MLVGTPRVLSDRLPVAAGGVRSRHNVTEPHKGHLINKHTQKASWPLESHLLCVNDVFACSLLSVLWLF